MAANSYKYELLFRFIDEGTATLNTAKLGIKEMRSELGNLAPNTQQFAQLNSQLRQAEGYAKSLSNAGKQTSTSFKDLHISTEGVRGSLEKMFKFGLALLGLHEGVRLFKSLHTELINFAQQHVTTAENAMKHYEDGINHFLTVVVNSDAFKWVANAIGTAFDFVAVLLKGKETWEAFLDWLGGAWEYLWQKNLSDYDNVFHIMWLTAKSLFTGDVDSVRKAIEAGFVPSDAVVMAQMNMQNKLKTLQTAFHKEQGQLKLSALKTDDEKERAEIEKNLKEIAAISVKVEMIGWGAKERARRRDLADEEKFQQSRGDMARFYAGQRRKIEEVERDDAIEGAKQKEGHFQAISKAFGDMSSLMQTKNKEMFAVGKAAAIAQATMDAYASANAAYKALAGIPIIGPALGAAAAAAAIVAGMVNVSKIAGTSMSGGGGGGGGSAPSGGGSQRNYSAQTQTQNNNQQQIIIQPTVYALDGRQLSNRDIWSDVVQQMYMEMNKKQLLQTQPVFGRP